MDNRNRKKVAKQLFRALMKDMEPVSTKDVRDALEDAWKENKRLIKDNDRLTQENDKLRLQLGRLEDF